MAKELAFVLINPYTIRKSRTGGVIGHIMSRTRLDLVAARMFGPSRELAEQFAALVREEEIAEGRTDHILANYVLRTYMPDAATGQPQRVMMLLFEGESAIRKVRDVTGHLQHNLDSGKTLRDIYGDYIQGEDGKVMYVEPAVVIGPRRESAFKAMQLWAEFSGRDGGLIEHSHDVSDHEDFQKTLVLIKPDNFRFPSARPGKIIDMFSGSGLRIIAAQIVNMSVAQAEEFYKPVRQVLRDKFRNKVADIAVQAINKELGLDIPEPMRQTLGSMLAPHYGDKQFNLIIKFMTGATPADPEVVREEPGKERCLALVYAGVNAVNIIRDILGPTDPAKAEPGSVRREFGQDVMVNAAHASDSVDNARREMNIIRVDQDQILTWVQKYYPAGQAAS